MMDQENLLKKLDELFQKISTLEKSLHDKNNPSVIVKMDVKDLHLQELNIDELAFQLEKLDIKELSGMLNLGNTFSPNVNRKQLPKNPAVQKNLQEGQIDKRDDIQININGKPVSYTMN
ncbi:hypothetical protein BGM25_22815 [Bacillus sp. FJAT-29953]|uniref:Uncharacterized protein n=2 Tax=Neobacillus rhizophilus TaxID=2833579 RepID=A0A942UCN9_9BACI|nr:hypothetical protein [Neobacillus rhizophilus]MBU8918880.1 hypothetical protein [Bacillus sp. FJAT-29953]